MQLNTFSKELQKSSGNINQLVAQLSAEREGDLRRREETIETRDRELGEKRKALAERKLHSEQRRRKIQLEVDDILARQQEEKQDFEKLKGENSIEVQEGERHATEMRVSRNHTIEADVDTRRTRTEREKVASTIQADERDFQSKLDEMQRIKRQLVQSREELKAEVAAQERDIKQRAEQARESEREASELEREYIIRE